MGRKYFQIAIVLLSIVLCLSILTACDLFGGGNGNGTLNGAPEVAPTVQYTVTFSTAYGIMPSSTVDKGNSVSRPDIRFLAGQPAYLYVSGWFFNADFSGEQVEFPYTPTADVTLYTRFSVRNGYFKVTVHQNNNSPNADYEQYMNANLRDNLTQHPPTYFDKNIYHEFLGWYETEDFSGDRLGVIPERDIAIYAKWGAPQIGFTTAVENSVNYIYMGEAPRSLAPTTVSTALASGIADSTIAADENGYYTYQNKRYARRKLNNEISITYSGDYIDAKFSNGTLIEADTYYYFEVEPIKWRVLGYNSFKIILVQEELYDMRIFDDYANNSSKTKWDDSQIKTWLNNTYFDTTFNDLEEEFMFGNTVSLMSYDQINALVNKGQSTATINDYGRLSRDYLLALAKTNADQSIWNGAYWSMTKDAIGVNEDENEPVYPSQVYICTPEGYLIQSGTGSSSYRYVRPVISLYNYGTYDDLTI